MDSYVKAITLDVNADENYTIIKAKQGDKINRKIAITLKKDGANFTPTGVSQIWFRIQKPDNNIAIVKSTDSGSPISTAGNVYTVTLSEQCLTAAGKAWCDLAFLDSSGNTLSSCAFILNIIPMPNGDTARSSSAWTDLQQAIDDAERFAAILAFRTSGNYIQYTVNGTTWNNLCTVGAIGGDLQTQIDALNGAITRTNAQITPYQETSTTASRAYKMGNFLELNGTLYRVKTAIANGDTLTPNTNIVQDDIGAELPSLSPAAALTLNNTNTSGGDTQTRIYGNFMYISGYITCNGTIAGKDAVLGTFPSDYYPSADINFLAFANYNNTGLQPRMMRYKTTGELVTQVGSGTISGQIFFVCSIIPYIK